MAPRLAGIALLLVIACGGSSTPPPSPPASEPIAEPAPPPAAPEPAPSPPAAPPPAVAPDPDRPAIVTDEMAALAEEMVLAMEELGRALSAADTDCVKGSASIRSMMATMRPLVQRAKQFEEQMKDPAAEEWFRTRYMDRMTRSVGSMMSLAAACSSHPDFQAAMQEIEELDG